MDNKGFTLVELLGVIVVLSLVSIIAYSSVSGYIETSKKRAEEKFVDDISIAIESYLDLYGSSNFEVNGSSVNFSKRNGPVSKAWEMKFKGGGFTLQTLINELKITNQFQNPASEGICDAGLIDIEVYKDDDYVYYYYVDMKNAVGCSSDTIKNIDTRPANLKSELCSRGVTNAC